LHESAQDLRIECLNLEGQRENVIFQQLTAEDSIKEFSARKSEIVKEITLLISQDKDLNKSILKAKMPKEVQKKCMSELRKLKNMSPMSAEATVVRNYLDWMIDLPWFKKNQVGIDLNKALKILDEDHYGLEKVKERILEYLAVQKRVGKIKGAIFMIFSSSKIERISIVIHSRIIPQISALYG